jgi:outer membrane receptor for ferrienterochelin and colicin
MMFCRKVLSCLFFISFFIPLTLSAQVTTSSLSGTVKSSQNEALVGATVKAVHVPTQTIYMGITRTGGLFTIPDMQPGGPYTIEVTYTGLQAQKKNDVFLNLGENQKLDFKLPLQSENLQEVVVSTTRSVSKASGGSETNISAERISNLPTVNRNLYDYIRLTPQATVDGNGGVSIGGMNNRYNSLMIDGAVNNDVFGLSAQGTNGGQTGISPISIDAIEQISVAVSPFDVSQGNFTGGAINAITRRGTNNFHGSAYFFFKNQDLSGKDPDPKNPHVKLQNFSSKTYGFRLGGPLVKNKLFFFLNAEQQRDKTPQTFNFDQYEGNATRSDLDALRQYLIQNYDYDPGEYENSPYKLDADKIVARIDWNASTKHKVSFSHRYSHGEAVNSGKQLSSGRSLKFSNSGIYFPSTTNSSSLEVNSRFTNKLNNRLIIGLTRVNDDRDPMGDPFPYVSITDGPANISFGSEQYSTGNQLKQNNLTLFDEFKIFSGKHNFSFGIDGELSKSYNLFIRQNYGVYNYNSLADFMNNAEPGRYARSYSLVDNKTGDGSAAAADFKVGRISFFAQDKMAVNSNFTLNYGVRVDHWDFITAPFVDTFFNNVAAPFLSNY